MTCSTRRRAASLRPAFCSALNPIALAAALAVSAAPQAASATTYTWTGQSSNYWTSSLNWLGNSAPPTDGLTTADIVFATSNAVAPSLSSPYSIHSLTFNSGASAYSFSLNALTIGYGGINQNASNAQTFSNQVVLGDNQTWYLASGAGALNFNGGVNTTGGPGNANRDLTINAATPTGSGNTVAGVISGGGSLYKTGAGILNLAGASTYTGDTYVNAGTLAIGSGAGINSGVLSVSDGATLTLSGSGSAAPSMGLVVDGTLNLSGSSSLSTGASLVGITSGGTVNQSGGSFTTNGKYLIVGASASGNTYNLSGSGSLSTGDLYLQGGSNFYQSGGSLTTNGNTLYLYGDSTFNQSGGSLASGGVFFANGSFNLSGGSLTTGSVSLGNGNGTFNLNGGKLAVGSVSGNQGTGSFNFNGGTLQVGAASTSFMQGLTTANVQSGGATIDSNGYDVTIAQNLLHDTTGGAAALDGGLTKLGEGTLTLSGVNTFTGTVNVNAGTLAVASESNLGRGKVVNVIDTGTLQFTGSATLSRTYNLGTSTLTAASGNTLTIGRGGIINGGFLTGAGSYVLTNGATLNATRAGTGTVLNQSAGTVTFNNVFLTGTSKFTQAAGGTLNTTGDFTANPQTTLVVNGAVNLQQGGSISGALTVNNGGVVTTSGGAAAALYLDGSRGTTVSAGGRIRADSGTTLELGGLLINNGTQSGVLNVNLGGVAKGSGVFGTVNVGAGGTFSPGNSPGTATATSVSFASGGNYQFELNTATPNFGVNADLLVLTDALSITAGTAAGSVFTISIDSLNLANQSAALGDFNSSQTYHWLLVDANAVSGFDSSKFDVDTSGFSNTLNGGSFSVSLNGNDLYLNFIPAAVPEPASWAMWLAAAAMGAGGTRLRARRRRMAPG
jgi:autotransporter-associated beta strand protein